MSDTDLIFGDIFKGGVSCAGNIEIAEFEPGLLCEKKVVDFDIAMDDRLPLAEIESVADLSPQLDDLIPGL